MSFFCSADLMTLFHTVISLMVLFLNVFDAERKILEFKLKRNKHKHTHTHTHTCTHTRTNTHTKGQKLISMLLEKYKTMNKKISLKKFQKSTGRFGS